MVTKIRIGTWDIGGTDRFDLVVSTLSLLRLDVCMLRAVVCDCHGDIACALGGKWWSAFVPCVVGIGEGVNVPNRQTGMALVVRRNMSVRWVTSRLLAPAAAMGTDARGMLVMSRIDCPRPLLFAGVGFPEFPWSACRAHISMLCSEVMLYLQQPASLYPVVLSGGFGVDGQWLSTLGQAMPSRCLGGLPAGRGEGFFAGRVSVEPVVPEVTGFGKGRAPVVCEAVFS